MVAGYEIFVESQGAYSHQGTKYGTLNQDSAFVQQLPAAACEPDPGAAGPAPETYAAAVLDGHGMLGEECSRAAGAAIRHALLDAQRDGALLAGAELKELFYRAFTKAHHAGLEVYKQAPGVYEYPRGSRGAMKYKLKHRGSRPFYCNSRGDVPLEFGATCTACVVQGNAAILAHVGDSTAVLGWADDEAQDYDGEAITRNHNFEDPEEEARCLAIPGVSITRDRYLHVSKPDGQEHEVNMSRALGHQLLQDYGLIPDPDIGRVDLGPQHCCLILASDGVWDHLSPREAVRLVMEVVEDGGSAAEAAEALASDAVQLAVDGGDEADNTTAVVFVFDTRIPAAAPSGARQPHKSVGQADGGGLAEKLDAAFTDQQGEGDDGAAYGAGEGGGDPEAGADEDGSGAIRYWLEQVSDAVDEIESRKGAASRASDGNTSCWSRHDVTVRQVTIEHDDGEFSVSAILRNHLEDESTTTEEYDSAAESSASDVSGSCSDERDQRLDEIISGGGGVRHGGIEERGLPSLRPDATAEPKLETCGDAAESMRSSANAAALLVGQCEDDDSTDDGVSPAETGSPASSSDGGEALDLSPARCSLTSPQRASSNGIMARSKSRGR